MIFTRFERLTRFKLSPKRAKYPSTGQRPVIMNGNERRPERAKSGGELLILPFQGVVDTPLPIHRATPCAGILKAFSLN